MFSSVKCSLPFNEYDTYYRFVETGIQFVMVIFFKIGILHLYGLRCKSTVSPIDYHRMSNVALLNTLLYGGLAWLGISKAECQRIDQKCGLHRPKLFFGFNGILPSYTHHQRLITLSPFSVVSCPTPGDIRDKLILKLVFLLI